MASVKVVGRARKTCRHRIVRWSKFSAAAEPSKDNENRHDDDNICTSSIPVPILVPRISIPDSRFPTPGQSPAAVSPSNKCHSKFLLPSSGHRTGHGHGYIYHILVLYSYIFRPSPRTVDFLWKIKICKQLSSQFEFCKYAKRPRDFRAD